MKTVRLDADLERRLTHQAQKLGVSESEVIRMALDQFCGQPAGQLAPVDDMLALIEQWERDDAGQPAIDVARHSSRLFGDLLFEEWARRHEVRRVAEEQAGWQAPPPD